MPDSNEPSEESVVEVPEAVDNVQTPPTNNESEEPEVVVVEVTTTESDKNTNLNDGDEPGSDILEQPPIPQTPPNSSEPQFGLPSVDTPNGNILPVQESLEDALSLDTSKNTRRASLKPLLPLETFKAPNSSSSAAHRRKSKTSMMKLKNNKLEPLADVNGEEAQSTNTVTNTAVPRTNLKKTKVLKKARSIQAEYSATNHRQESVNHENGDIKPHPNNVPTEEKSIVPIESCDGDSHIPVLSIDPEQFKKGAKIIFAVPQGEGKPAIPIACEVKPSPKTDSVFQQFGDSGFEVFWRSLVYFHLSKKVEKRNKTDVRRLAQEEYQAQQQRERRKSQVRRYSKFEKESRLLYLTRPTLNHITGSFRSGQMTAIMGPSGAGKTVFLNVITARLPIGARKENSGDILINGTKQARIGFVEQYDQLLPHLSVRETLLMSSRIKNAARYYLNHEKIVENVIARLDLYDCKDIYASKCSNGQRKRLSIGIELCFNSDILILDEPTTGLDSVTSFGIMSILKNLTRRRKAIAILATIHQPSIRLFNLFDNLLVLSKEGTIIYEGSPDNLASTLSLVGLRAPLYTNMSDFLLEVASGDFGRQSLHQLAHYNKEYNRTRISDDLNEVEMHSLQEAVKRGDTVDRRSFLLCTWLLIVRTVVCNFRNPFNTKIRFSAVFGAGTFLGLLFTQEVGRVSTCPPNKYFLWNFEMHQVIEEMERQQMKVQENIAAMFMVGLVALFNSLLNLVVTFPIEVAVFRREYNNYSYMMLSFFIAKLVGDLPFTMSSTILFGAIIHHMTGQLFDTWTRPLMLILPCCFSTMIGQFIGMTIGVIFADNITASVYSVMFIIIPIIMFSGIFRLLQDMVWYMQKMMWMSPLKHIINSMMIVTYGMDRCAHEIEQERETFLQRNITEEEARPKWINSLTTLVTYQLQMNSETEENEHLLEVFQNSSIEPEIKLISFLGLEVESEGSEENSLKAIVLQHFKLGSTSSDYWNEIESLVIYCVVYAVILYACMSYKYSSRK